MEMEILCSSIGPTTEYSRLCGSHTVFNKLFLSNPKELQMSYFCYEFVA